VAGDHVAVLDVAGVEVLAPDGDLLPVVALERDAVSRIDPEDRALKRGNPHRQRVSGERTTGLEPATLSLGS
jgi:hypothetical protein